MTDRSAGDETWKAHTSAFDRVRSVAGSLQEPRSAAWIAEEALVSENTARDHLERLVEMNVLLEVPRDGGTSYAPDPLHTRLQTVRDLLEAYDHDELLALQADLQEQLEAWREQHGVDSPDGLRERAAGVDTAEDTRRLRRIADDWELTRYRLTIVRDAVENYAAYTRGDVASA